MVVLCVAAGMWLLAPWRSGGVAGGVPAAPQATQGAEAPGRSAADAAEAGRIDGEAPQARTLEKARRAAEATLLVRVLGRGFREDIPIALFGGEGQARQRVWLQGTGRNGAVVVPATALAVARQLGPVRVAVALPTREPLTARVAEPLPKSVALALPRTEPLNVTLRYEDGTPFQGQRRVCLRALEPGERIGHAPPLRATWVLGRETEVGQVRFGRVGQDSRLMLWTEPVGTEPRAWPPKAAAYLSPPGRGVHQVSVCVDDKGNLCGPWLAGRAVTRQGKAWSDATLRAVLPGQAHMEGLNRLCTDGEGRFQLGVGADRASLENDGLGWLSFRAEAGRADRAVPPLPPPGGSYDLGVLVLDPDAALVRGAVHDETGEPVSRAFAVVLARPAGKANASWVEVPGLGDRTDEDGEFAIRGAARGELRLAVRHRKYAEVRRPVVAGGPPVAVTMKRGGSLVVSVSERCAGVRLNMELLRTDGKRQRYWGRGDVDGYWEWEGLPAGTYELKMSYGARVVRRIEGVQVVAGEDRHPAELQNMPVCDQEGWVRLRPHLEIGTLPITDFRSTERTASVRDLSTGERATARPNDHGAIYLAYLPGHAGSLLEVQMTGFAPVRVARRAGVIDVELQKKK